MQVILRVLHGEGLGEERLWPIGQHLFGRASECQMRFPVNSLASRRHCLLCVSEQQVSVRDLGSRNGTWVWNQRITEEHLLRHGDHLRIADTVFLVLINQMDVCASVHAADVWDSGPPASESIQPFGDALDAPSGQLELRNGTWGWYEILVELGRGTTGIVYKALDPISRLAALKIPLLASAAERPQQLTRFLREAQVLAILTWEQDQGFPTVREVGEVQKQPYYVREFIEGSTFEDLVTGGCLCLREGVAILAETAETVQRVHGHGCVHRNLHPSNVLVTSAGAAKLIGFGMVGLLPGPPAAPAGSVGLPAAVDLRALARMLEWLCSELRQEAPAELEALCQVGSVPNAARFAEILRLWLSEQPSA